MPETYEKPLEWKRPDETRAGNVNLDMLLSFIQNFQVTRNTIKTNSVSLLPEITGSALIIDKSMASTSFFNQVEALRDYKGTIFCCDRALYSIIPYRVPEYVVNVDASHLCLSFFDRKDVKDIMLKTTAIFAVTTNPITIRLWHGARYFFTPGGIQISSLDALGREMAEESGTVLMATGGQVASTAYLLAYNLGAKTIGTFGITHSYDDIKETEYPNWQHLHKRVKGPHGTCWVDPMYQQYNDVYLAMIGAAKKTGVTTVNTSQNGILYSENVVDMSLREFVEKYA